jgi:hypothetical protein
MLLGVVFYVLDDSADWKYLWFYFTIYTPPSSGVYREKTFENRLFATARAAK